MDDRENVCFSWFASGYDSRNNHLVAAGGLFFRVSKREEKPPKTQTRTPNHSPQDSFARRTTSNKHDRNILTPRQKMYINKQKKEKKENLKNNDNNHLNNGVMLVLFFFFHDPFVS